MTNDKMSWIDEQEKKNAEKSSEGYFAIVEGDNRFQLLSHVVPLPLKWTGSTYEPAEEGDTNVSIKGVCWVLQDGKIKLAKLPYTAVKAIRELMNDPDYAFDEFPMPRMVNLKAKGAGTKEVEYNLIPSPKETTVSDEIAAELAKKLTPDEMVEKEKSRGKVSQEKTDTVEYPTYSTNDSASPDAIPF